MSVLEKARREFWEAWNGLSEVHTQEELEYQSKKMWAARKRLWDIDPEFRARMWAEEEKRRVEAELYKTRKRIQDTILEQTQAKSSYMAYIASTEKGNLVCPECFTRDINWKIISRKRARREKIGRNIPWCLRCNRRMIRLSAEEVSRLKEKKCADKLDYRKRLNRR